MCTMNGLNSLKRSKHSGGIQILFKFLISKKELKVQLRTDLNFEYVTSTVFV